MDTDTPEKVSQKVFFVDGTFYEKKDFDSRRGSVPGLNRRNPEP